MKIKGTIEDLKKFFLIKKKINNDRKNYKNIYVKFAEEKKIGFFFFCKVIGYKSEN